MSKTVHRMERRDFLAYKANAITSIVEAALYECLCLGDSFEEVEKLRPSLQRALMRWWNEHNTNQVLKTRSGRLRTND